MSSEVYRASGRGGAGNFWSKAQIAQQEKAAKEDIEAQKLKGLTPSELAAASEPAPGSYVRAGRGGAGNYYEPSERAKAEAGEKEAAEKVRAATVKAAKYRSGFGGRGGMGNWAQDAAAKEEEEREEAKRQKVVEARIAGEVEAGLKMPTPAYKGT